MYGIIFDVINGLLGILSLRIFKISLSKILSITTKKLQLNFGI